MRCEKQGTAMKIFMFVSAILVFASTVLIKQHVVIDIIGGVLVVEIGLFLAKKLNTKRIFAMIRFFMRLSFSRSILVPLYML